MDTGGGGDHGRQFTLYDSYGFRFEVSIGTKYEGPIHLLDRDLHNFVFSAVNSQTREVVTIKKFENAFQKLEDDKRILREVKILRQLHHENVISLKDIIRPPQKDNFSDVYLVFEFMGTDLEKTILKDPFIEDRCQVFLYKLLRGLKYIHSANVWHRDLKPNNLLINPNTLDLKIGGFGLARTISQTDSMTENTASLQYRSPELLLDLPIYTSAIDIWSVGCIFGALMCRKPLFPGNHRDELLKQIVQLVGTPDESSLRFIRSYETQYLVRRLPWYMRQPFSAVFPNASYLAVDLLEKMLVFDPTKRITVNEALAHPYFARYHNEENEPVCHQPLNFEFEQALRDEIEELIWRESVELNPDP